MGVKGFLIFLKNTFFVFLSLFFGLRGMRDFPDQV